MRNYFMAMHDAAGRLLICVECGELKEECKCNDIILLRKKILQTRSSKENMEKFLDDW